MENKIVISKKHEDGAPVARAVLLEPVDGINDPGDEPCMAALHIVEIRGPDAFDMLKENAWNSMQNEFWDINHFNLIWARAEEAQKELA